MKSYGQYCALARALDVVGDRWTLLVVRELMSAPRRYSELRAGLPGIATNLLADRLRQLEADGVVDHDGDRYSLTPRGTALGPVLEALVQWGVPLMATGQGADEFRPHWLPLALGAIYRGARTDRPVTAHVTVAGRTTALAASPEGVSLEAPSGPADVTLTGPADDILGVLTGMLAVADAAGVSIEGSRPALRRLITAAVTRSGPSAPIS